MRCEAVTVQMSEEAGQCSLRAAGVKFGDEVEERNFNLVIYLSGSWLVI